jgi:ATP-dependent Clp protease ATP-binding subunit ClpC
MLDRFSDRAKKVMALANQEAQRFNHEYIGTEHVLLGLVKEGSGVGASVLKNLDVDLRKVRIEVEKLVKSGGDMLTMGKLPHTPRTKRVIEHAVEEARSLNHNYVGTEHLLLGLIREHDGVAAHVLLQLGLTLEGVREEVLSLLGMGVGDAPPASDTAEPYTGHAFTINLPTELAVRVYRAADHESKETGGRVTPGDLIRRLLEQHFPPPPPGEDRSNG